MNMQAQQHALRAPLSGTLLALEQVPDPVFAQRMIGDGVALEPESNALLAPCDGTVAHLHEAYHAITLETETGLQVLLHIGIDTVQLAGEGFLPHVAAGQAVKTGDVLIEFDPDYLRAHARSLLTMMLIVDMDGVSEMQVATGQVRAGEDVALRLQTRAGAARALASAAEERVSAAIEVTDPAGLHARPAAVLASVARRYQAAIALCKGDREANAKSVLSVMQLDVRHGDQVLLRARGSDAESALGDIAAQLEEALRAAESDAGAVLATAAPAAEALTADPGQLDESTGALAGVTASPGLALGSAFRLRRQRIDWPETAPDPQAARRELERAIERAQAALQAMQGRLRGQGEQAPADILAAQQELLGDPDIAEMAYRSIGHGKSAPSAWHAAIEHHSGRLAALDNELLAARASDLRDVGERVLRQLVGQSEAALDVPAGSILIAEELTPSQASLLDGGAVRGFCTTMGTSNSHVAIVARSLGIPALVGMDARILSVADGTPVLVDAERGAVHIAPSDEQRARTEERIAATRAELAAATAHALEPARTSDGHAIAVLANLSHTGEIEHLRIHGAEGVGLLRSEFLFAERSSAPDEDEQSRVYGEIAGALGAGQALVIRTLDVGGDKPLAYLPLPREDNPFLGERGIRVGLNQPQILRTQLRAVLRAARAAAPGGPELRVMFPMIATLEEWRQAKAIFDDERARLAAESEGGAELPAILLGIMVEVPAVALLAEQFAREVDFFSIGTNDLAQYTLAMDRGNPAFAAQLDGLSPALVQLVARTVAGARAHGKRVSVCGNLASDLRAVPILIGLGVDALSVDLRSIPRLKQAIRSTELAACEAMANAALQAGTSAEIHALSGEREA